MTEPLTDATITEALRRIGRRLAKLEATRRELYDLRLEWWQRAVEAGWTQSRIADVSLVKLNAVTQTLYRARQANPQERTDDGSRADVDGGALGRVPDGGSSAG
jgi:hypothetical protein